MRDRERERERAPVALVSLNNSPSTLRRAILRTTSRKHVPEIRWPGVGERRRGGQGTALIFGTAHLPASRKETEIVMAVAVLVARGGGQEGQGIPVRRDLAILAGGEGREGRSHTCRSSRRDRVDRRGRRIFGGE
jgi:hypothetical protein